MIARRTRINLGTVPKDKTRINRAELFEKLLNYLKYERRLSQTSIKGILSVVNRLLKLFDLSVIDQNLAIQVEEYYLAQGAKPITIRHALEALEHVSAAYYGQKVRFAKPKLVKKDTVDCLSIAEARALLESAKNLRDRAIIALLLYTGLRSKELVALNIDDIDLKNRVIHVRAHDNDIVKNYHERTCVLSIECVNCLRDWLAIRPNVADRAVFLSTWGRRMCRGSVHRMVAETGKRAGINKRVYTHLLRHTAASTMIKSGIPITEVALQLGHRSLLSTMIYLHANIDELKKSVDEKFTY